jgi:four helix bundle protein
MHYEDLRIYKLAKKLRDELHEELKTIPHYWSIEDVGQALRSSSSSVSNIVEGHGRKFYPKDNYRFLGMSMASSDETQNHIIALTSNGHMSEVKGKYFKTKYKTLSIQTLNYMNWIRQKYNL